jgi:DNA primase
MITSKTIEKILDTAQIEDVVGDFVNLKRAGSIFKGLCPFHQERTPSFTVNPTKNFFKCYGCNRGGDAIQFIREHEGLSYPEAIKYLAKKYHIEVEETGESYIKDPEDQTREELMVITQFARDFYQQQIFTEGEGKNIGLAYFKERGLRENIIKKFELGYAYSSGSHFVLEATRLGYKMELLQKAGLVTKGNRDFFWERVMFTIHSVSGKPIAFAGRIMGAGKGPKYINSPETPIYSKTKTLYGLYQARQAIRRDDNCYLVEGYTDVLSLVQGGIENVVASSGTALTVEQILLIKRFTSNITILYDGDSAGLKAAMRGLNLVLEQDMNVRLVMLPEGQDPDSYLGKIGSDAFREFLAAESKDFILFKTQLLLDETKHDPILRSNMVKEIVQSIALIPDTLKRSEYTKLTSETLNVDESLLIMEINKLLSLALNKERSRQIKLESDLQEDSLSSSGQSAHYPDKSDHPGVVTNNDAAQEFDLCRVLISGGDKTMDYEGASISIAQYILDQIEEDMIMEFKNPAVRSLFTYTREAYLAGEQIGPPYFLNHPESIIKEFASKYLTETTFYSENWEKRYNIILHNQPIPEENFQRDAIQAMKRFQLKKLEAMCSENGLKIKEAFNNADEEQLIYYMKFQKELQQMRNSLASDELNTVIIK